MPRILLEGSDEKRTTQKITIDTKVTFRSDFYKEYPHVVKERMKLLETQLGEVLKQWFNDYGSDIMSNHEYNLINKGADFFNR